MLEYIRCPAKERFAGVIGWCGSEVEQLTRNEQAVGSIPTTSSRGTRCSRERNGGLFVY